MQIEDDDTNPWRWIGTARVGVVSEIIIADRFGPIVLAPACFLNDDGHWYQIEPPRQLSARVVAWRHKPIEVGNGKGDYRSGSTGRDAGAGSGADNGAG